MKNIYIYGLVAVLVAIVGFFALNAYIYNEKQAPDGEEAEYKKIAYSIDGQTVSLGSEVRYFGNELFTDINNDGRDDVVFLVTHDAGGTGTYFYVVAALSTEVGYVGSEGYLLGDRIAPQTTVVSQDPQHHNVIVVNYADRAAGEPMTTAPSVGKSAYLKLDIDSMQWGIVDATFSGEADPERMSLGMKTWIWQGALYNDGREIIPAQPSIFTLTFTDDTSFSVTTDCNSAGGAYTVSENILTFKDVYATKMYCEGSQEAEFLKLLEHTNMYHFTTRGELIFDLKYDSGTVTFR